MVSTNNLLQTILVLVAGVGSALAQPQGYNRLDNKVSLMPRIPSHAKYHEVLQARSRMVVDHNVLVKFKCLDPAEYDIPPLPSSRLSSP